MLLAASPVHRTRDLASCQVRRLGGTSENSPAIYGWERRSQLGVQERRRKSIAITLNPVSALIGHVSAHLSQVFESSSSGELEVGTEYPTANKEERNDNGDSTLDTGYSLAVGHSINYLFSTTRGLLSK